jgi:ankyrin repeat protein
MLCCAASAANACNAMLYTNICYDMLYYTIYYTLLYYTILYVILCYAMLYYTMLYYAMLYYATLCYAMLCYTMLCCLQALIQHCGNSDPKRVEKLLAGGVEGYVLNYQNNGGSTALVTACGISNEKVSLKIVNILIAAGIDIHAHNKNSMNALMMASSMSFPSVVERLLELHADYELKNKDGKTAMQLSKSREVRNLIQDVIDNKEEAAKQAAVQLRGQQLVDLLLLAAEAGGEGGERDNAEAEEGGEGGEGEEGKEEQGQEGQEEGEGTGDNADNAPNPNPVKARKNPHLDAIESLIASNEFTEVYNVSVNLEERGCPYRRPAEVAVHCRLAGPLEWILRAGADPDVTHSDGSCMLTRLCGEARAASYPHTAFARDRERLRYSMIEALIVVGKAALNGSGRDTWTPLMLAGVLGNCEDCKLLLAHKARPDILDTHTDTALILATKRNQVGAVQCLLNAKAKPDLCGAVSVCDCVCVCV